jgi:hypothetical protein
MMGAAIAWRLENKEPSAPPSITISYRESIGRENAFLYELRECRTLVNTVGNDSMSVGSKER